MQSESGLEVWQFERSESQSSLSILLESLLEGCNASSASRLVVNAKISHDRLDGWVLGLHWPKLLLVLCRLTWQIPVQVWVLELLSSLLEFGEVNGVVKGAHVQSRALQCHAWRVSCYSVSAGGAPRQHGGQ